MMYVIVGITCVVIFTFLVIGLVIIVLRRKSSESVISDGDIKDTRDILDRKNSDNNSEKNIHMKHVNIYGGIFDMEDTIVDTNDTIVDIETHKDTYITGYQLSPVYARPVPRNKRNKSTKLEKQPGPEITTVTLVTKNKLQETEHSNKYLSELKRVEGDGAEEENDRQVYSDYLRKTESQYYKSEVPYYNTEPQYYRVSTLNKVSPPTLPKPTQMTQLDVTQTTHTHLVTTHSTNNSDHTVRNCTKV